MAFLKMGRRFDSSHDRSGFLPLQFSGARRCHGKPCPWIPLEFQRFLSGAHAFLQSGGSSHDPQPSRDGGVPALPSSVGVLLAFRMETKVAFIDRTDRFFGMDRLGCEAGRPTGGGGPRLSLD